jgi:rhodanese-related sulfurtransferase
MTRPLFARYAFAALAATTLFASGSVLASPSIKTVHTLCKPGSDPQSAGPTKLPTKFSNGRDGVLPQKIAGATTVSAREAKCLIQIFDERLFVLAAMNETERLPRARDFRIATTNSLDPQHKKTIEGYFSTLVTEDKKRPILVYCHHERCALSYNTSVRLVDAGYENIYWLREGLQGWLTAGYPLHGDNTSNHIGRLGPSLDKYIEIFETATAPFLTLHEKCGAFDDTLPSLSEARLNAAADRHAAYASCYNSYASSWKKRIHKFEMENFVHYSEDIQELRNDACSIRKTENCIKDWALESYEIVLNPTNAALVQSMYRKHADMHDNVLPDVLRKAEAFRVRLSERIDVYNEENRSRRRQYSAPAYSPPSGYNAGSTYSPPRRPSGTSAYGIK